MTRQTPNRHAAQRRDVTRRAAACVSPSLTPRSSHAAQRRVSSLPTRRAAACVFPFSHAAQRRVSAPLTRRAAACVFNSLTLPSSHAAQRRVPELSHTPRSGVCLPFLSRRAAACVCTPSHAAQRLASPPPACHAAHMPRSGDFRPPHAAQLRVSSPQAPQDHTPRRSLSLTPRSSHAAQRRVSAPPHAPCSGVCLHFLARRAMACSGVCLQWGPS
jgi:hypothetical protein